MSYLAKSTWDTVDWSKPNHVISAELGVVTSTVSYQRRKRGQPRKRTPKANRYAAYQDVDWSKTDSELARQYSKTRQWFFFLRRTLAPETVIVEGPKKKLPKNNGKLNLKLSVNSKRNKGK